MSDAPLIVDLSDNLRDRIAAAIEKERNQWAGGDAASETLADAVIEALRLRPVEGTVSRFESKTYRRYITDWTPDD